jgi:hypothetical protein
MISIQVLKYHIRTPNGYGKSDCCDCDCCGTSLFVFVMETFLFPSRRHGAAPQNTATSSRPSHVNDLSALAAVAALPGDQFVRRRCSTAAPKFAYRWTVSTYGTYCLDTQSHTRGARSASGRCPFAASSSTCPRVQALWFGFSVEGRHVALLLTSPTFPPP